MVKYRFKQAPKQDLGPDYYQVDSELIKKAADDIRVAADNVLSSGGNPEDVRYLQNRFIGLLRRLQKGVEIGSDDRLDNEALSLLHNLETKNGDISFLEQYLSNKVLRENKMKIKVLNEGIMDTIKGAFTSPLKKEWMEVVNRLAEKSLNIGERLSPQEVAEVLSYTFKPGSIKKGMLNKQGFLAMTPIRKDKVPENISSANARDITDALLDFDSGSSIFQLVQSKQKDPKFEFTLSKQLKTDAAARAGRMQKYEKDQEQEKWRQRQDDLKSTAANDAKRAQADADYKSRRARYDAKVAAYNDEMASTKNRHSSPSYDPGDFENFRENKVKITKENLMQLIKEEIQTLLESRVRVKKGGRLARRFGNAPKIHPKWDKPQTLKDVERDDAREKRMDAHKKAIDGSEKDSKDSSED